jgi:hypothetical protein
LFLIMRSLKKSLQFSLYEFFHETDLASIPSKSAFSQRRNELKHEIFIALSDQLVAGTYEENQLLYWNDFRLLAIDGSTLNLPQSQELIDEFGTQGNQFDRYPMAQMSCCFDLLNHLIVAAQLTKYQVGEFRRACNLIEIIGDSPDLLLFDRGYGGLWFFHYLTRNHKDYVIRLSKSVFKGALEQDDGSEIRTIESLNADARDSFKQHGETFSPFKLRLVHLTLDNGEPELLATSLIDTEQYPDELFKDLYAMRWGIEESYKHLKCHAQLENFSGKSAESVYQDFYANIFTENLRVMIELDANEALQRKNKDRANKYTYQVNRNLSLGFLRDNVIDLLNSGKHYRQVYRKLAKLFQLVPIAIIKGRHNPRFFPRISMRPRFFMSNRRAN